jgi:hypothetical protein
MEGTMIRDTKLVVKAAMSLAGAVTLVAGSAVYAEVTNYSGSGDSRAEACANAKLNARNHLVAYYTITEFGSCDCSREGSDAAPRYTCNVDVYYRKNS